MNEFADRLHGEGHFESGKIRRRKQAVLERRSKVKGAAVERRNKLEDCRKLMVFLQNVMEVSCFASSMHNNIMVASLAPGPCTLSFTFVACSRNSKQGKALSCAGRPIL